MSNWNMRNIDSEKDLTKPVSALTCEDLAVCYKGAGYNAKGKGFDRVVTYRIGVITNIGNIEESLWLKLATEVVTREQGAEIIEKMKAFYVKYGEKIESEAPLAPALEACLAKSYEDESWNMAEEYKAFCAAQ